MSSSGGTCSNCGGSNCNCGDDKGPYTVQTKTVTLIAGAAPVTGVYEMSSEGGNNDCKCGSNCSCDNCTCK